MLLGRTRDSDRHWTRSLAAVSCSLSRSSTLAFDLGIHTSVQVLTKEWRNRNLPGPPGNAKTCTSFRVSSVISMSSSGPAKDTVKFHGEFSSKSATDSGQPSHTAEPRYTRAFGRGAASTPAEATSKAIRYLVCIMQYLRCRRWEDWTPSTSKSCFGVI